MAGRPFLSDMRLLLTFSAVLLTSALAAQVNNYVETDCVGQSQTLWDAIADGRALVISPQPMDHAGCGTIAENFDNFTQAFEDKVTGWAAMSLQAGSATCFDIDTFVEPFEYNNVFFFLDSAEFWRNEFEADWIVIDPADTSVAYAGENMEDAFHIAHTLGPDFPPVSTGKNRFIADLNIGPNPFVDRLTIRTQGSETATVRIVNLMGETVYLWRGNLIQNHELVVPTLPNGTYVVTVQTSDGYYHQKLVRA